jgi:phenylacetate-CoA ligase
MSGYFDPAIETMDRTQLPAVQLRRLNHSLRQARRSPFYAAHLCGCKKTITSFDDLAAFPCTTKEDLRANFPYGLLAVPLRQVVRLHSSSGTTGNPTVVFHTKQDIARWADMVARCMHMAGAHDGDIFQNTMGYGLFTGGLGFHYGAEKLGMLTIPVGPGNSKRQLWFMQQFKTSVVHILPSYALRLALQCRELGIDPAKDLHLRIAFIGAEPHTDAMRREIERLYNIKAYNSYGLSEICGPGVAFECAEQNGMHIWEDAVYPEIIDPATGKALPDGSEGELVLTTLRRDAMPLIRYRTRDLTSIIAAPCACGRTHRRISRIAGRSDDMLIINGVNIFPLQIEKAILRVPAAGSNYRIEITKEQYMDKLSVHVELRSECFSGTLESLEHIQRAITEELKSELGITPAVILAEQGTLPVSEGKAARVQDKRKQLAMNNDQ